jgi:nicotinate-nucleotide pyrophosphorylase (carboxylating)
MFSQNKEIKKLIELALNEDIGSGDITSNLTISPNLFGKAIILAKSEGVLAGIEMAGLIYKSVDKKLLFKPLKKGGNKIKKGDKVALIQGNVRSILAGERTVLNFLQRLSGIATMTSKFVAQVKGTKAQIIDTRKTTPGFRLLEKQAVKMGGGENHRLGLYDMVLIKGNHFKANQNKIEEVLLRVRKNLNNKKIRIEAEAKSLTDAKRIAQLKIDRIMLDNFKLPQIKNAVREIRKINLQIEIEASGNVNLRNVRKIAQNGVDFISVGALTHSAKAVDFSLILE